MSEAPSDNLNDAVAREQRRAARRAAQKPSVAFDMPDLTRPGDVVSAAEVAFFRANGFLVRKRMLDPVAVAAALDLSWRHLLAHVPIRADSGWALERDDATTWRDPQWATMPPHPTEGPFQGRWPVEHYARTVKLHDIGDRDEIVRLLPNDPGVRAVAEALLGDLRPSVRTRGVYAVFPPRAVGEGAIDPTDGAELEPHTDQVCQQLNVCAYLDDVPARSGGFTVYPGSHERMFHAHRLAANWSPLPSYRDTVGAIAREVAPYELTASPGSVIFWHGRLVHSAGLHRGRTIRWAVFADFSHDRPVQGEDEHRRLGQYEWFKDTFLFAADDEASGDMWRRWRLGAQRDDEGTGR